MEDVRITLISLNSLVLQEATKVISSTSDVNLDL